MKLNWFLYPLSFKGLSFKSFLYNPQKKKKKKKKNFTFVVVNIQSHWAKMAILDHKFGSNWSKSARS